MPRLSPLPRDSGGQVGPARGSPGPTPSSTVETRRPLWIERRNAARSCGRSRTDVGEVGNLNFVVDDRSVCDEGTAADLRVAAQARLVADDRIRSNVHVGPNEYSRADDRPVIDPTPLPDPRARPDLGSALDIGCARDKGAGVDTSTGGNKPLAVHVTPVFRHFTWVEFHFQTHSYQFVTPRFVLQHGSFDPALISRTPGKSLRDRPVIRVAGPVGRQAMIVHGVSIRRVRVCRNCAATAPSMIRWSADRV